MRGKVGFNSAYGVGATDVPLVMFRAAFELQRRTSHARREESRPDHRNPLPH